MTPLSPPPFPHLEISIVHDCLAPAATNIGNAVRCDVVCAGQQAKTADDLWLTTFQGLVIKGMGFSALETTLIQMPSGGVQLVLCPLACFFASCYHNARIAVMLVCLAPLLAGILGLWLIDQSSPYARLAYL
ncbi:hypothetical protein LX36DRAFT_752154 [Colletotrichum falcatum]|nr:hypothetical protein LX36DRAFT_752154 [Colletotrichum falcatum]